jgi:hypothetical protein
MSCIDKIRYFKIFYVFSILACSAKFPNGYGRWHWKNLISMNKVYQLLTETGDLNIQLEFVRYLSKAKSNNNDLRRGDELAFEDASVAQMAKDMEQLHLFGSNNKSFSDVRVLAKDGKVFHAHRCVLGGKRTSLHS